MSDQPTYLTEVIAGIAVAALSWVGISGRRKRKEIDDRLLRLETKVELCIPREEVANGFRGIHKRLDDLMMHIAKGKE
jgi:hypothetical protein